MNKDMNQSVDTQRREFMRDSISASVSVAVVAAVPGSAVALEEETPVIKKQQRYHLSNHILDYYKSAAS
ncbi:MAG: transcriptional initiation protein Tat [gamma proteobacterium symbiont of Lucinoma myriamae]|nr:transcriptional initiation protein Tat [gamma proteobacterium symbiont of Lucinoma myriamae]